LGLNNVIHGTDTLTYTNLVQQQYLDNYFYGQNFSVQIKKPIKEITFGASWSKYNGKHYGNIVWASNGGIDNNYTYYKLDALKTDWNVYAKWQQYITKRWIGYVDIQYRNVFHKINGFKNNPQLLIANSFNFINPKFGVTYTHKGFQAYVSYAMAQKEPNRADFEAATFSQPKAEMLHDIELGFEKKWTNKANFLQHTVQVNAYAMLYKNQLVLTGKINDVGATTRTNVDKSYRLGVELQGVYNISQ
jgi:iron complex outermembrane receptor protein